jgi:type IV pilus assembly protein PilV
VDVEAADMKHSFSQANRQSGVMLIEALIALLIFSIGILGIVGLQAAATSASIDAKYRSEAALLANKVIGDMWASDRTQATLQGAFKGGDPANSAGPNFSSTPNGAAYAAWAAAVCATLPCPPGQPPRIAIGVSGVATNLATVTPTNLVIVTIFWQAPHETTAHNYVAQAQIGD